MAFILTLPCVSINVPSCGSPKSKINYLTVCLFFPRALDPVALQHLLWIWNSRWRFHSRLQNCCVPLKLWTAGRCNLDPVFPVKFVREDSSWEMNRSVSFPVSYSHNEVSQHKIFFRRYASLNPSTITVNYTQNYFSHFLWKATRRLGDESIRGYFMHKRTCLQQFPLPV